MRIFASGTLRGRSVSAINSFATQNRSCPYGATNLDLVIGRYANDGIVDARNDARADGDVGCRDMCGYHGNGPASSNVFVKCGEHDVRPCRATAPKQVSGKV